MSGTGEVRYLVLTDRALPYLLARVRWPDVAQAISAASPDWLDDPGLFDLPYDPSAVTVSFPQAASVAAGWGRRLHPEAAEGVPSYIRRMPADWSDLSRSERRTWGIEFVGRRRAPARRIRRLRSPQGMIANSSAPAQANGHSAQANGHLRELVGPGEDPTAVGDGLAGNGHGDWAEVANGVRSVATERRGVRSVATERRGAGSVATERRGVRSVATERRHQTRVRLDGRAHIRCEHATISASLVDLSERGVGCLVPEAPPLVTPGATLEGPFVLEAEIDALPICLDVVGRISWDRSTGAGTHFGVSFEELAIGEAEGVRRFLAAATRKGVHR